MVMMGDVRYVKPWRYSLRDRVGAGYPGDALQLWGCWVWYGMPYLNERVYWVGGRCAAGCHSVGHFVTNLEMDSLDPADLAELMSSFARDMLSDLAVAHFMRSPEPDTR
jgi:hypothetical protein